MSSCKHLLYITWQLKIDAHTVLENFLVVQRSSFFTKQVQQKKHGKKDWKVESKCRWNITASAGADRGRIQPDELEPKSGWSFSDDMPLFRRNTECTFKQTGEKQHTGPAEKKALEHKLLRRYDKRNQFQSPMLCEDSIKGLLTPASSNQLLLRLSNIHRARMMTTAK